MLPRQGTLPCCTLQVAAKIGVYQAGCKCINSCNAVGIKPQGLGLRENHFVVFKIYVVFFPILLFCLLSFSSSVFLFCFFVVFFFLFVFVCSLVFVIFLVFFLTCPFGQMMPWRGVLSRGRWFRLGKGDPTFLAFSARFLQRLVMRLADFQARKEHKVHVKLLASLLVHDVVFIVIGDVLLVAKGDFAAFQVFLDIWSHLRWVAYWGPGMSNGCFKRHHYHHKIPPEKCNTSPNTSHFTSTFHF